MPLHSIANTNSTISPLSLCVCISMISSLLFIFEFCHIPLLTFDLWLSLSAALCLYPVPPLLGLSLSLSVSLSLSLSLSLPPSLCLPICGWCYHNHCPCCLLSRLLSLYYRPRMSFDKLSSDQF